MVVPDGLILESVNDFRPFWVKADRDEKAIAETTLERYEALLAPHYWKNQWFLWEEL